MGALLSRMPAIKTLIWNHPVNQKRTIDTLEIYTMDDKAIDNYFVARKHNDHNAYGNCKQDRRDQQQILQQDSLPAQNRSPIWLTATAVSTAAGEHARARSAKGSFKRGWDCP